MKINAKYIHIFALCLFVCVSHTIEAKEFTVEDAYKALPHSQTTFNKSIAVMSTEEAKYLDHLFFVTDLAFRERMMMLRLSQTGKSKKYIDQYNKQINNVIASFELIAAPNKKLQNVENIVVFAIREQQEFFNQLSRVSVQDSQKIAKNYAAYPLVQSSHKKLIQAYNILKSQYPNEAPHNQKAFFDHLCALDFI